MASTHRPPSSAYPLGHIGRDQRGSAAVEMPFALCIMLVLAMGITTLVQLTWTHLSLSSGVRTAARYAAHVDYDPSAGGIDRRRTEEEVRTWTALVAAEADVDEDDVTIVGRHLPSGQLAPLDELVAGDEIVITVEVLVSNPLYRLGASIANAASSVIGAGDVFDPEGVGVKTGATTNVE